MDAAGEKPAERPSVTVVMGLMSHKRRRLTKADAKADDNSKPSDLHDSLKLKLERRIIMKKIYGVVTLAAVLMGATLLLQRTVKVAAAAAPTGIKNVVLVHGAFADGSGWEAVANILKKDGYTVSVAQPPETSYADDQKYTKAAIDAMGGPVVLVGHSYGGS